MWDKSCNQNEILKKGFFIILVGIIYLSTPALAADPSPQITSIDYSNSITTDQTITVWITVKNNGGYSPEAYFSPSFSNDWEIIDYSGGAAVYPPGSRIWHKDGYQISAQYTLIDWMSTWNAGESKSFWIKLKPKTTGNLWFNIRVAFLRTAGDYSIIFRDPNSNSGYTDQQGYYVYRKFVTVSAPVTQPDLTVTSVSFSPSTTTTGQSISVTFTVKNQGGSASGSFYNRISLGTSTYGTDYNLGYFSMNSLAAGASNPVTISTNSIPSSVPTGNYYVTVYTDGYTTVAESNENNNIGSSSPTRLTVSAPPPSNTAPSASRYDPSSSISLTTGESKTFTVRCTDNEGNLRGVDWYLNGQYKSHGSPYPISGSSATNSWSYTFNSAGTYTVEGQCWDDANGDGNEDLYSTAVPWTVTVIPPVPINNPPYQPYNPSPTDGATGQPTSLTLRWSGGDPDGDTVTYSIYQGTNPNPTTLKGSTTSTYWSVDLGEGTTYYWKILASDGKASPVYSPVWRFTTQAQQPQNPTLSGTSIYPLTVLPGESFTGYYTINNPNSNSIDVGLGLSIRRSGTYGEIVDTSHDVVISAAPGTNTYSRTFTVPSGTSAGSYDVAQAIWSGSPGTGTQYATSGWKSGALTVSPIQQSLFISVSPTSKTINSGDSASFSITVTDQNGNGVSSATVGIEDNTKGSSASITTNSYGYATYTTKSTSSGYIYFTASKQGYIDSNRANAYLTVNKPNPPAPSVSTDTSSFSIEKDQTKQIIFNIQNNGGNSTKESYLSISVSSGLEIIDYHSSSPEMGFGLYPQGSSVWSSSNSRITSSYQLLDAYKSYSAGESATVTITIRAKASGSQWIKYRTAFSDGSIYYRNPTSGSTDQQGWYAFTINGNVKEPIQQSLSVLVSPTSKTVDSGDSSSFSITVTDQDGKRVGSATVGVEDSAKGYSTTLTTDNYGSATYTTNPTSSGYIYFTASKQGYKNSNRANAYVSVNIPLQNTIYLFAGDPQIQGGAYNTLGVTGKGPLAQKFSEKLKDRLPELIASGAIAAGAGVACGYAGEVCIAFGAETYGVACLPAAACIVGGVYGASKLVEWGKDICGPTISEGLTVYVVTPDEKLQADISDKLSDCMVDASFIGVSAIAGYKGFKYSSGAREPITLSKAEAENIAKAHKEVSPAQEKAGSSAKKELEIRGKGKTPIEEDLLVAELKTSGIIATKAKIPEGNPIVLRKGELILPDKGWGYDHISTKHPSVKISDIIETVENSKLRPHIKETESKYVVAEKLVNPPDPDNPYLFAVIGKIRVPNAWGPGDVITAFYTDAEYIIGQGLNP